MLKQRFLAGESFSEFLHRPKTNSELWDALYKRATLSDESAARAARVRHPWHLLVLSEDWCGDSINTLPVIARLTEAQPLIEHADHRPGRKSRSHRLAPHRSFEVHSGDHPARHGLQ